MSFIHPLLINVNHMSPNFDWGRDAKNGLYISSSILFKLKIFPLLFVIIYFRNRGLNISYSNDQIALKLAY